MKGSGNSGRQASRRPARPKLPRVRVPVEALILRFQEFFHIEASGGIALMASMVIAMLWVNLGGHHVYEALWHTPIVVGIGDWVTRTNLHHLINDGLMALFFFVVGLEIKRELLVGELASFRKAALPALAALGGMVVPALIYASLNYGTPEVHGWGVPMATDIAFALGVLALLGSRVPDVVKVFLAALAIIDDIGAVLVIALFYTSDINWGALGIAGVFFCGLLVCNIFRVRNAIAYWILGFCVWAAFLSSGVHATVAGIVVAATIPLRCGMEAESLLERLRSMLREHQRSQSAGAESEGELADRQASIDALQQAAYMFEPPLQRFERALHSWVTFGVVPLFALANAGVLLTAKLAEAYFGPVSMGIVLGLVVGKPLGIVLFSWFGVRCKLAVLPEGTRWYHILGAGCLAGIGFTMALFIANLAFTNGSEIEGAKAGILSASVVAGLLGWFMLAYLCPKRART
ncbi:MAG: Na+/H+ antiporter NhaA [Fimbriimonadia bacterium]